MSADPQGVQRLFFAFWPTDATRQALLAASRSAVLACGGRPVAPGNLHVTLAFLGNVDPSRLDAVQDAGAQLAGRPLTFVFDRVMSWRKHAVLVATAADPDAAGAALAARLWRLLAPHGFEADPRPYRPHVTLARKVATNVLESLPEPVVWTVREIALVRSESAPAGVHYRVLTRWPLAVP